MTELKFNILYVGNFNFLVGSNITNFFAIGDFMKKEDFYMIGWHEANGSIVMNAKVFSSDGKPLFELENNHFTYNYNSLFTEETISDRQGVLHSLKVTDRQIIPIYAQTNHRKVKTNRGLIATNVTEINGEFHNKSGELVVTSSKNGMIIHNLKSVFGASKTGGLGMNLGCTEDETNYIQKLVKSNLT